MPTEQPDFKETYAEANNLLANAERKVDDALRELPKNMEDVAAAVEKEMYEKAEKVIEMLKENGDEWEKTEEELLESAYDAFLPKLLDDIPPIFAEKFVKKIFSDEVCKKDKYYISFLLSRILKILGETYAKRAEEEYEKNGKREPIQPLNLSFSEQDFVMPIKFFGEGNPKHVSIIFDGDVGYGIGSNMNGGDITINGNAGNSVGNFMLSGNIIINGNARDFTGSSMQGGTLTITGTSSFFAGDGRKGGTLSIGGEVESFSKSAFSPDNKGTIIWKGVKIFEDGKKMPEFKNMKVPA